MVLAVHDLDRARDLRRELKIEWAELWRTKLDDRLKAEAMANRDFRWLFVDQGQILFASRDFKPVSLGEVMERHIGSDALGKISPDPSAGGWRRFAKEKLPSSKRLSKNARVEVEADPRQQKKNNGRGWLNRKSHS